jgi:hypothetical protein
MTRLLLALVAVWLSAPAARADMSGPILLPGQESARVVNRIEIAEEQPDYVFVVHRVHTRRGEESHQFVELQPGRPLELTGAPGESVELLLVRRPSDHPERSAAELIAAMKHRGAPLTGRVLPTIETVPAWSQREITVTYLVRRNSAGNDLEIVRTSWHPVLSWCGVALLFPVAVIWCGFRLLRWARRPRLPRARPVG